MKNLQGPSIVIGDINLPEIDWDRLHSDVAGREFLDTVQDVFMTQHVNFPTHDSGSTIDLVLSSNPDLVSSVSPIGKLGSSEHAMMMIQVAGAPSADRSTEMVPDWKNADWERLKTSLQQVDWSDTLQAKTGLQGWDVFKEILESAVEQCIPKKKRRASLRPIWLTPNVMRAVRKKRRLWKTYTLSNDYAEYMAYKRVEKEVKKAVRHAKYKYERELSKKAKKDPKAFYSYMKKKTSNKVTVGPLKDEEGATVTDDQCMAELLNTFFSSVFTQEDLSKLPSIDKIYRGDQQLNTVHFRQTRSWESWKSLSHCLLLVRIVSGHVCFIIFLMFYLFHLQSFLQNVLKKELSQKIGN